MAAVAKQTTVLAAAMPLKLRKSQANHGTVCQNKMGGFPPCAASAHERKSSLKG